MMVLGLFTWDGVIEWLRLFFRVQKLSCNSNSRSIYTFDPQLFVVISPLAIDLFCGGTKCVTKCLRNICKTMKDHPLLHAFTITTKIANGGTVPL